MTKNFDHRKWLSFVQKAATLPMEFTESDFVWLKEVAAEQYPSLVPLISACLSLTRGGVSNDVTLPVKHASVRRVSERTTQLRLLQSLLESKALFPTNSHLVAFAKKRLSSLPDHRFDKMSRERIARSIAERVTQTSPDYTSVIIDELRVSDTGESTTGGTFLTDWENTIKTS